MAKLQPVMRRPNKTKAPKVTDALDNESRGDGVPNVGRKRGREPKVMTALNLPVSLKERAQSYAEEHGTTLTFLVCEGLRHELDRLEGQGK